jgi:hypothetical protein
MGLDVGEEKSMGCGARMRKDLGWCGMAGCRTGLDLWLNMDCSRRCSVCAVPRRPVLQVSVVLESNRIGRLASGYCDMVNATVSCFGCLCCRSKSLSYLVAVLVTVPAT